MMKKSRYSFHFALSTCATQALSAADLFNSDLRMATINSLALVSTVGILTTPFLASNRIDLDNTGFTLTTLA